MNETVVKEHIEAIIEEAPAAQLPAIQPAVQRRMPRVRRDKAPAYSAKIAVAVLAITREMEAVEKAGQHEFHKYFYPRWEDINNELAPRLAEHDLIIVQNEISRDLLEKGDKGSVLAIVYHFTFVNVEGEAWPPIEWTGICRLTDQKGMTDDKAALKCQTSAEKSFCMKQFKIRTKDLDKDDASPTLPKKDARDVYTKLQAEIDGAESIVQLESWGRENVKRKRTLPPDWQDILTERYNERFVELQNQARKEFDDDTGEIQESASTRNADPAPAPSAPTVPLAGAGTFTDAEEYVSRWQSIIVEATDAKQLHDAWTKDKSVREAIMWPGDGVMFANLKTKVTDAIEFMKKPKRA